MSDALVTEGFPTVVIDGLTHSYADTGEGFAVHNAGPIIDRIVEQIRAAYTQQVKQAGRYRRQWPHSCTLARVTFEVTIGWLAATGQDMGFQLFTCKPAVLVFNYSQDPRTVTPQWMADQLAGVPRDAYHAAVSTIAQHTGWGVL
jgi:hypothetical protein